MNIKAEIIPQDAVVNQVKELQSQKNALDTQADVLERRLEQIKASLAENEELRKRNTEILELVLKQVEEEKLRSAEFYPDIRLAVLTVSAALNAPPKK
ncbi:MAG: hypothetical protein KGP28_03275 [Bdellovibrionales bacterium]|nr:hypothetical protein [Bdellovibrionales bacterium]